jgi:hypothetical protein
LDGVVGGHSGGVVCVYVFDVFNVWEQLSVLLQPVMCRTENSECAYRIHSVPHILFSTDST